MHLVERNGNETVYIDKFESAVNSVRMVSRVGLSLPMVYTAVGKAIDDWFVELQKDNESVNIISNEIIVKRYILAALTLTAGIDSVYREMFFKQRQSSLEY